MGFQSSIFHLFLEFDRISLRDLVNQNGLDAHLDYSFPLPTKEAF